MATPDTSDKSNYVLRDEYRAKKKVSKGTKKVMKPLSDALTGKTKSKSATPPKEEKKPSKVRTEKKTAKPVRKSITSSYRPDTTMNPDEVESTQGTYSEKLIINDIAEVVNPIETQKLNRGAEEMSRAQQDAPNLWTGLAPLAMGAIMGDIDVGASIGGELLLDEGLRNREERLKRQTASSKLAGGSKTPHKVIEDGKVLYRYDKEDIEGAEAGYSQSDIGRLQEREGVKTQAFVDRGRNLTFGTDQLGRDVVRDRMEGSITPINTANMSPFHVKQAQHSADKFNSVAQPIIANTRDLETGLGDLISNNQLSNKLSVMRFIKEVETRLSDYDRAYYTQEIADASKLRERARKVSGNEMNPRLLKDTLGLLSRAIGKNKRKYSDLRKSHGTQLSARDFPKDKVDSVFGSSPSFTSSIKMYGNGGSVDVPLKDVQKALQRGFLARRPNEK